MNDQRDTNSEREGRLDEVITAVLRAIQAGERVDAGEWCQRHPDLADDLASFFANREQLERLAVPLRAAAVQPGDRVRYLGDYEIIEEIARGGMGVVCKARQVSLNRAVALKMILKGQLASEADVQRFRQEAEAAANLDHPNIVPIYEVGEDEGQHYFSMKLIEGRSLADPEPRPVASLKEQRTVAALIAKAARAVHYAHQRSILHRDLKPSNILLDGQGEPQVTDFGLARRLGEASQIATQSGAIVGTPSYMSPEQAGGEKNLTTAVDIYGLGAIFYELLTGRPPFRADSLLDTLIQVRQQEAVPPRTLNPAVDRDLDTICLKCLEKDPARRYGSAEALAEDLERWLRGEPITARRAGTWERVIKWARRRPTAAALVAVSTLALVVIVVGLAVGALLLNDRAQELTRRQKELEEALDREGVARRDAQRLLVGSQIDRAADKLRAYQPEAAEDLLDACKPADELGWEWFYLKRLCHRDRMTLRGLDWRIEMVAFSPDGRRVAGVSEHRAILWDTADGRVIRTLTDDVHRSIAFSADGKRFATCRDTFFGEDERELARAVIRDAETGEELRRIEWRRNKRVTYTPNAVAFSLDGKLLATCACEAVVRVFDIGTGKEKYQISGDEEQEMLAFSPNGKWLAAVDDKGNVVAVDVNTGAEAWRLPGPPGGSAVGAWLAFTPDCRHVASYPGGAWRQGDVWIRLVPGQGEAPPRLLNRGGKPVRALAFSPDGNRLATSEDDGTVKVWDWKEPRLAFDLLGASRCVAFSPDGKLLATAGTEENVVKLWDGNGPRSWPEPLDQGFVTDLGYSPDGKLLAVARRANNQDLLEGVEVWETDTGKQIGVVAQIARPPAAKNNSYSHYAGNHHVAFSPDGKRVAVSSGLLPRVDDPDHPDARAPGDVTVWDVTSRARILTLPQAGAEVVWSADGQWIATVNLGRTWGGSDAEFRDGRLQVWDAISGRLVHTIAPAYRGLFSPDGKRLAVDSGQRTIDLFRLPDFNREGEVPLAGGHWSSMAFSPDGNWLAYAASHGKLVMVREMSTGRVEKLHDAGEYSGGGTIQDRVGFIAWSPDGRRLASFREDSKGSGPARRLCVWDTSDWREVFNDPFPDADPPGRLVFSPDGGKLVGTAGGRIRVWDGTPLTADRRYSRMYGRKARQLVEDLFGRYHLRNVVREHLEADTNLEKGVRDLALAMAEQHSEDTDALNSAAWDAALPARQPAEKYQLALRQIEGALRVLDGRKDANVNGERANGENTRGLVLYRLGRSGEAETAFLRAIKLRGEEDPTDAVCLALVRSRLGRTEEARADLGRCRALLEGEKFKNEREQPSLRQLMQEAEELVGKSR